MFFLRYFIAGLILFFSGSISAQPTQTLSGSEEIFEWRFLVNDDEPKVPCYNKWKVDLSYSSDNKKNFRCSFLTLNNLARAAESINEPGNEAFDCLHTLLVKSTRDISLIRGDFQALTGAASGSVMWRGFGPNPTPNNK